MGWAVPESADPVRSVGHEPTGFDNTAAASRYLPDDAEEADPFAASCTAPRSDPAKDSKCEAGSGAAVFPVRAVGSFALADAVIFLVFHIYPFLLRYAKLSVVFDYYLVRL